VSTPHIYDLEPITFTPSIVTTNEHEDRKPTAILVGFVLRNDGTYQWVAYSHTFKTDPDGLTATIDSGAEHIKEVVKNRAINGLPELAE
jgi:hypothetical protein